MALNTIVLSVMAPPCWPRWGSLFFKRAPVLKHWQSLPGFRTSGRAPKIAKGVRAINVRWVFWARTEASCHLWWQFGGQPSSSGGQYPCHRCGPGPEVDVGKLFILRHRGCDKLERSSLWRAVTSCLACATFLSCLNSPSVAGRVTRRVEEKSSPNISKSSPKYLQHAQFDSPKYLH
jgi:hypothetical protein